MTMALCVKCGAMKHGAFTPCSECRAIPDTEIDIAYTLLFSDHHFEESVLQEISQSMLAGAPRPVLPPEQEEQFLEQARPHMPALMEQVEKLKRAMRDEED